MASICLGLNVLIVGSESKIPYRACISRQCHYVVWKYGCIEWFIGDTVMSEYWLYHYAIYVCAFIDNIQVK